MTFSSFITIRYVEPLFMRHLPVIIALVTATVSSATPSPIAPYCSGVAQYDKLSATVPAKYPILVAPSSSDSSLRN